MRRWLALAVLLLALPARAVQLQLVEIGDPGNAPDAAENCLNLPDDCGSVPYEYTISKYEITNAEYAEFLNAVAAQDTNELFDVEMYIERSGSQGSYTYAVMSGHENEPVIFVSWYSALRFANWLHNGQPAGAQDATTTEDGAYTLGGPTTAGPRNPGARAFLPSENEWYKAAYYDPALAAYHAYPAGSDTTITCAPPTATPNTANCGSVLTGPADVGSYPGSPSPGGTFDQGGNVWEWDEEATDPGGGFRGIRGGDWSGFDTDTAAAQRGGNQDPATTHGFLGFRVAPEPGAGVLVVTGVLVMGVAGRWRRRGSLPCSASRAARDQDGRSRRRLSGSR